MNINNQRNGFTGFQPYTGADSTRFEKSTKAPEKKDHVNSLISKAEIQIKELRKEEKSAKVRKEFLDGQIAVSEDGDTVELSKAGVSKLDETRQDEGTSIKRELEETEAKKSDAAFKEKRAEELKAERKEAELKREFRKEAADEAERKAELRSELLKQSMDETTEKTTDISFAGKSDGDIARMYLRGDITKAEYDNEIESRENKREVHANREEKLAGNILGGFAKTEEMSRFDKELKLAFSDDAPEPFSPTDRLKMIEVASGTREEEGDKKKAVVS